ncbi:MAG TPA: aldo/keto reductase [Ilumatobacter sp.]|nr:aldo/keto reductase [Ilumatobacter sp.]
MSPRSLRGLETGAVGFGAARVTTDPDSVALVNVALDRGASLLDTADFYGPFTNEIALGHAIEGRRDQAVITTKVGMVRVGQDPHDIALNGQPDHVRHSCDGSLKRLDVDHIDLYLLHRVDPAVPIEETFGAMADLKEAGKVRHIGLCSMDVETLCRAEAVHPITAVQVELSLFTRDALVEVVPWCDVRGIGVIAHSPLGRGILGGSIRDTSDLDSRSALTRHPRYGPEALAHNVQIVESVGVVADRLGATTAQVALAWLLAQNERIVPIPRTTNMSRLHANLDAGGLRLTQADLDLLDALPSPVGSHLFQPGSFY